VPDPELERDAALGSSVEGIDFSPEGGAALTAARILRERGVLDPSDRVLVFNTGAGWLYRNPEGDISRL
jgi:hypothetical protein